MRTKIFIVIVLLSNGLLIKAQTLTNFVIGSAGNSNPVLTYCVGEVGNTTIKNADNSITQGFVQPDFEISTSINENNDVQITVYPNPVEQDLWVKSNFESIKQIRIIDISGKQIYESIFNTNSINFAEFTNGIYFLEFYNMQNQKIKTFKLIKQ